MLSYVLGHRPDEFGLAPDREGFVPIKELLQGIHEEAEWRFVRRSHINEVLVGNDRRRFESDGERIRSVDRQWEQDLQDLQRPAGSVPKILFTPVRQRAHPVVLEKGLKGYGEKPVVLSPNRAMAMRRGRRRDPHPVILEILAASAAEKRIRFHPFGDLFLCAEIPSRFIAGPPVPKEMLERAKGQEKPSDRVEKGAPSPAPGTFTLDPSRDPDPFRKAKGKKRKGWKEDARKIRKRKS